MRHILHINFARSVIKKSVAFLCALYRHNGDQAGVSRGLFSLSASIRRKTRFIFFLLSPSLPAPCLKSRHDDETATTQVRLYKRRPRSECEPDE